MELNELPEGELIAPYACVTTERKGLKSVTSASTMRSGGRAKRMQSQQRRGRNQDQNKTKTSRKQRNSKRKAMKPKAVSLRRLGGNQRLPIPEVRAMMSPDGLWVIEQQ